MMQKENNPRLLTEFSTFLGAIMIAFVIEEFLSSFNNLFSSEKRIIIFGGTGILFLLSSNAFRNKDNFSGWLIFCVAIFYILLLVFLFTKIN